MIIAAAASYAVPKLHTRRPRAIVCKNCGNHNPPFATAFCVKCGHPLKQK
jgi:ribosomal protein L40E